MRLLSLPQCLSHASITWCRAPWQQFPENGDNYTWRRWVTKMPSSPLTRTCSRKRGIWAIRPLFAHSVINRMRLRVVNAWWLVSKTWHSWSGSPRCGTSTISSAKNFLVFATERLVVKIGAEIEVLGCPGPGWCSWRWRSRHDDDSGNSGAALFDSGLLMLVEILARRVFGPNLQYLASFRKTIVHLRNTGERWVLTITNWQISANSLHCKIGRDSSIQSLPGSISTRRIIAEVDAKCWNFYRLIAYPQNTDRSGLHDTYWKITENFHMSNFGLDVSYRSLPVYFCSRSISAEIITEWYTPEIVEAPNHKRVQMFDKCDYRSMEGPTILK